MRTNVRTFLRQESAKLREMTFRQRVKYIWQYFGIFIIAFIGIVWLGVYFIVHLRQGEPEYWLYAAFANTPNQVKNESALLRDFEAYSGYDTREKRVEFSTNMYFAYTDGRIQGLEYYNSFVALADTGTLDLITMHPEQLAALGQSGRLMDWNMEECQALREKYADRLIYYQPPEGAELDKPFPVGIDISDSLLVSKYNLYASSLALGITVQSGRLDAVGVFLDFILQDAKSGIQQ